MLGDKLEQALGIAVYVEDKPGAGGLIDNDARRRAPGGNYVSCSDDRHACDDAARGGQRARSPAGFHAGDQLCRAKVVLAIRARRRPSLKQLVALARRRSRQLNYGSTGSGARHLSPAALTGMELAHIPYRGSAQTVAALMSNEVQVLLASVTAAQPALASGRVQALAVLADRRSPLLPGVPTIVEAGLPHLDVQTWIGILAPAGTPPHIVLNLNLALNRALRAGDVRTWLDKQGLEPIGGTPEAFDAEIRADLEKWGKVTRRLGIRPQ